MNRFNRSKTHWNRYSHSHARHASSPMRTSSNFSLPLYYRPVSFASFSLRDYSASDYRPAGADDVRTEVLRLWRKLRAPFCDTSLSVSTRTDSPSPGPVLTCLVLGRKVGTEMGRSTHSSRGDRLETPVSVDPSRQLCPTDLVHGSVLLLVPLGPRVARHPRVTSRPVHPTLLRTPRPRGRIGLN